MTIEALVFLTKCLRYCASSTLKHIQKKIVNKFLIFLWNRQKLVNSNTSTIIKTAEIEPFFTIYFLRPQ